MDEEKFRTGNVWFVLWKQGLFLSVHVDDIKMSRKKWNIASMRNTSNSLHSSEDDSKLYIFENNEAVVKMMMKGRSPFMRYVARTQRITLDLFFDRINFDPKIQIRYVDTKI